ncbi:Ring finger, partial [Rhizoctonia solani]
MHTFGSLRVCFSSRDERQSFIRGLPSIPEKDVSRDDTCAICQETFLAIIATQEMASVMETPGLPEEDMGVVELPGCAHRFCRKDIATWVYSSFLPSSLREEEHEEGASILDAREMIRVLQLRASGLYDDADEARHNPFNEGGTGTRAPSDPVDREEQEYLRRMQDELLSSVFDGSERPREDSPPRESFGMYS